MANIFFKQGKMDVADSLFRQVSRRSELNKNILRIIAFWKVVKMWHKHLVKSVEIKTKISELDTILGKKEEEEETDIIGKFTFFKNKKILFSNESI